MENVIIGQDRELNKIATVYADENSKEKGYFPKNRKFKNKDKFILVKNIKIVAPTLVSVLKTPKIIKKHDTSKEYENIITKDDFIKLDEYITKKLGMDLWGVCELKSSEVFKNKGIPYKNVIVMSKDMNKEKFEVNSLPNLEFQIEVMKTYGDTGIASLKVTDLLRNLNYGAVPNHSLGGNIDYTKAGLKANLGFIGKNGLLITNKNGSCNRLSVVYTSIENLGMFFNNNIDHSWGYDFCEKCKKCVRECPHNAIYKENKVDKYGHIESISNDKCNSGFIHYGCGVCIGCCPFTTIGYDKLKSNHFRQLVGNAN